MSDDLTPSNWELEERDPTLRYLRGVTEATREVGSRVMTAELEITTVIRDVGASLLYTKRNEATERQAHLLCSLLTALCAVIGCAALVAHVIHHW